jgi:hypothetical protein
VEIEGGDGTRRRDWSSIPRDRDGAPWRRPWASASDTTAAVDLSVAALAWAATRLRPSMVERGEGGSRRWGRGGRGGAARGRGSGCACGSGVEEIRFFFLVIVGPLASLGRWSGVWVCVGGGGLACGEAGPGASYRAVLRAGPTCRGSGPGTKRLLGRVSTKHY